MRNFAYDIQLGFLAFPLVALLLALPYALHQYRRFGAVSTWKTFVVFTFILYCMCAVSLIVFPLPKDPTQIVEIAQTPQLHPFHFVEQMRETTDLSLADRSTWGPAFRSPVVYEAFFNVLLTVPLGAYLCYLFRCRWWMALLIGLATTLAFETSQLTGLFGIYDHPYRLFDVDDIILNTTGTMIGFWLMIPLTWALPSMDEVNERSLEKGTSRVTLVRRALAGLVDFIVWAFVFAVVWTMLSPTDAQIAKSLALDPSRSEAKSFAFHFVGGLFADPLSALLIALAIGAVLFAILPSITRGRTIGKALVGIRIVKADGTEAPVWSYWFRFFVTAFFIVLPVSIAAFAPDEIEGISNSTIYQVVGLVVVLWMLTIVARAIGSAAGYPYVSLSEVVSGTRLIPSKQREMSSESRKGAGQSSGKGGNQDHTSSQDEQANDWPDDQARSLAEDDPLADRVRQAREAYAEAGISSSAAEAETRAINSRQANPHAHATAVPQSQVGRASDQAISDKQAALDSLLSVNYDEQHPVAHHAYSPEVSSGAVPASAGADYAPTQEISSMRGQTANAAATQQMDNHASQYAPTQQLAPHADSPLRTQRISDPSTQRKLRRDSRPDAGGTQVFKRKK